MNPERWRRIESLFDAAIELPANEREGWLARECAGEPDVRQEVRRLLAAAEMENDGIEAAIRHVAGEIHDGSTAPAAGGRIGPYEIIGTLGRGGMGTVFLARRADDAYEKHVAIKLIRGGTHDPEHLLRFRMERQILADLEHPNIARVLDGGTTDDGDPYIVMEYVKGLPIDAYCDRHGLSVRRRVELLITVCEAVQCAHRSLVVHRDLKPNNILVRDDGEVRLLDFGIAKMLDPAHAPHTVVETRTAARMMTPEFAAPEQVRGEAITTATDVYALGVVLYTMLSGCRPYRIESYRPQDIERAVCESQPVRPSAVVARIAAGGTGEDSPTAGDLGRSHGAPADRVRRELAGDLDNIVLKALRKEPGRRYGSAEHLAGDLRCYLEGLPIEARPDTWRYRATKFVRRHAWGTAAASALLLLLIAFAATMTVQTARVTRQRDEIDAERARSERIRDFLIDVFDVAGAGDRNADEISARDLVDRGAARVREQLAGDPRSLADFLSALGSVYTNLGRFEDARGILEDALANCRQAHGPADARCAVPLNLLGMTYQSLGDFDAAESSIREGLQLVRTARGEAHADFAASLNNLGRLLHARGDLDEAEAVYRRALGVEDKIGIGGIPHAITLDNLAQTLALAGRYDEAETLVRESIEVSEAELGPDHARVATSLNNLADILSEVDRAEEAEQAYRRSLAISRRVWGEDHRETRTTRNNLALLLSDGGDLAGAETELRAVLASSRRDLGDDHPETATVMANLAGVLRSQGKLDEAAPLYFRTLEAARVRAESDPISLAVRLNNTARFLDSAGRPAEAAPLYRECLEILEREFGREHPYYASGLGNLALTLMESGDLTAAETAARESLELAREIHGEPSRPVAEGLHNLATILRARGLDEQAHRDLTASVAMFREVVPEGHPRMAIALASLGRALLDARRPADAEAPLREALAIRTRLLPADAVETAESRIDLGRCLAELGRRDEAPALLRTGLAGVVAARGEGDERVAEGRAALERLDAAARP